MEMQKQLELMVALIKAWQEEGHSLENEPEYDGGYGTALLTCARELEQVLGCEIPERFVVKQYDKK